jgi:hypothetical protein
MSTMVNLGRFDEHQSPDVPFLKQLAQRTNLLDCAHSATLNHTHTFKCDYNDTPRKH